MVNNSERLCQHRECHFTAEGVCRPAQEGMFQLETSATGENIYFTVEASRIYINLLKGRQEGCEFPGEIGKVVGLLVQRHNELFPDQPYEE